MLFFSSFFPFSSLLLTLSTEPCTVFEMHLSSFFVRLLFFPFALLQSGSIFPVTLFHYLFVCVTRSLILISFEYAICINRINLTKSMLHSRIYRSEHVAQKFNENTFYFFQEKKPSSTLLLLFRFDTISFWHSYCFARARTDLQTEIVRARKLNVMNISFAHKFLLFSGSYHKQSTRHMRCQPTKRLND